MGTLIDEQRVLGHLDNVLSSKFPTRRLKEVLSAFCLDFSRLPLIPLLSPLLIALSLIDGHQTYQTQRILLTQ